MKDQLRILYQLQVLEQQKAAVAARKGKVDGNETRRLWQEIRLLSQLITADREKLVCLEKVCSRQETDLAAAAKQCAQLEATLYGGEISNGKELEQLRAKWEGARRDICGWEEEAFANLEYYEELAAKIARDEAELQNKKRRHAETQQKMAQAIAGIDAELAALEEEYTALASRVETDYLRIYQDLGRKLPRPVARVENGICGGCRRGVPTAQAVLTGQRLVHCDNCGRILLAE
ncbi:MAG TPA: hypothetical protein PKA10_05775 [Selenomonadales bacterium]|nr:hypothetical protein [Selenomonadales bacterium]